MSSMESDYDGLGINLVLFKVLGFYQMIEPNGGKCFNRNRYRLACVVVNVAIGFFVALTVAGFAFTARDDCIDGDGLAQWSLFYLAYTLYTLKAVTVVRRGDGLWRMLDVARERFLVSRRCRERVHMFREQRARSIRAARLVCASGLTVALSWAVFPALANAITAATPPPPPTVTRCEMARRRHENVFNLPLPVSAATYDHWYALFYAAESVVVLCMAYGLVLFDAYVISLCYVFIVHYETIALSTENLSEPLRPVAAAATAAADVSRKSTSERNNNHDKNARMVTCYNDFRSILIDLQNVYLKLKEFYSIIRIITLSYVILHSGLIITLTYSFVVVFLTSESLPFLRTAKILSAIVYLMFVLFYLSYLMGNINTKKESIKFSMYSCNWTEMDLKMKKLLLLAMQMEDANKMMLKITPKKIVDIQLFSNVMLTCYNTISFMLQARSS